MISGWWLVLAFAIGVYVGITMMAAMFVASRDPVEAVRGPLGDDPRPSTLQAAWSLDELGSLGTGEGPDRKRSATRRHRSDQPDPQKTLQL